MTKKRGDFDCNSCGHWADMPQHLGYHTAQVRALTGHHPNCPYCPDIFFMTQKLLIELCRGIRLWAADEDGIHSAVFDAYRKAKFIATGEIVDDKEH